MIRKNIKVSKKPWTNTTEYKEYFGMEFGGEATEYTEVEIRTRQSIVSILNNTILYFANGTIAKDYADDEIAIAIECDNVDTPCPTTRYLNDEGILKPNPFWVAPETLEEDDEDNFLEEFQQDQLKLAQITYIEAMYSGWRPHFEVKRSVQVSNGSISNSQSTFEYADEFDQLPKQTRMHLRAMMITKTLKSSSYKLNVSPEDYVKYELLYDTIVQLHKDYKVNGTSLGVSTQGELNDKLIELIDGINLGELDSAFVRLDEPNIELLTPELEASQKTHNVQVVSEINGNLKPTLISTTALAEQNEQNVQTLANVINNSGKTILLKGEGGTMVEGTETAFDFTEVKNNYDAISFTPLNTIVVSTLLEDQTLIGRAFVENTNANKEIQFIIRNSSNAIAFQETLVVNVLDLY